MAGLGAACGVALMVAALTGCSSAPPAAAPLLQHASQRMAGLHSFQFSLLISGETGTNEPVQSATGEVSPPDLRASVELREGGFLVEVEVIYSGSSTYLKSITGGWQRLTAAQVAEFFDPRNLFDPQLGLFKAMEETQSPSLGQKVTVDGHDTYPVTGSLAASRVHQLLSLVRGEGSYHATYWIESPANTLWRARLSGNLFDPTRAADVTFDFSKHDQPISVTPPPLG